MAVKKKISLTSPYFLQAIQNAAGKIKKLAAGKKGDGEGKGKKGGDQKGKKRKLSGDEAQTGEWDGNLSALLIIYTLTHWGRDSHKNFCILIKISLKIVPKAPTNNIPALVQIMAWCQSGDKPLSESMMA